MRHWILFWLLAFSFSLADGQGKKWQLSRSELKDKIMGGWAGQTIGVTFGGPYEFRYRGTMIQDYQPLNWSDGYLKDNMLNNPGLYDDLYMDLTFVDVFERYGLDAPADSFATAFAHAGYMLWHANQSARYNILRGIMPPASGNWRNNPHADDIDYQIESDFAGLMSPGMPNTATAISDKVGHLMNYGDGWYGGVFIGAMYTLAFTTNNIPQIVTEALRTIPQGSQYHECIADVIRWYRQYPHDWKQTWFELEKKWSSDIGCPDGVFDAFNIDSKLNSAYVVLGLLYGGGDFGKTLEIAARAGQDADCNPSSAGGILGTILGYGKIPPYWKEGLRDVESINFKYTSMSLEKVYKISFKQALENIVRNAGKVQGDQVEIALQDPEPVRMEQGFAGLWPLKKTNERLLLAPSASFSFKGRGFVLMGEAVKKKESEPEKDLRMEVWVDGKKTETVILPTSFTTRRNDLCWNYDLSDGPHDVKLVWTGPDPAYEIRVTHLIVYGNRPKR